MTPLEINSQKQEFLNSCHKYIQREGLDNLLAYLEKSDFFEAPSSTRFHLNEKGGLCKHSLNVFNMASSIYNNCIAEAIKSGNSPFKEELTMENIAIACLFHDLCKIGIYHQVEKFRKDAQGRWETYLAWELTEDFPIGHAEKSLYIVRSFMRLEKCEALAIRWHMGMYDVGENNSTNRRSFYEANEVSALVSLVSSADFLASKCLELTTEL